MKQLLLLLFIALTTFSCSDDDDYGSNLTYTVCGDELIQPADRQGVVQLQLADWPTNVRTYIASEFPGYAVNDIISYLDQDSISFYLATMSNNGVLLFDNEGVFICGDASFSKGSKEDDDHDDDDDEYLSYDELPQIIKDYITTNYSDLEIYEIEFEDGKYEIEFTNDTEICFNEQGDFLGEC